MIAATRTDNGSTSQKMTFFNFYAFNRKGRCLFYKEWNRPLNTLSDDPDEEKKLVFGMLFSLKDLSAKLSPTPGIEGLHTIKTNSYTLHHYESMTGMMFVLNTDPEVADMYQALHHIYSNIFIECVVRNPLFKYNPDEPFNCPLFTAKLEEYLRGTNSSINPLVPR